MDKKEFLRQLSKGLSGLPENEMEERLIFYSEMIDDSVEEGLTEDEAVAKIGSVDAIICQICEETPLPRQKRNFKGWEIALIILGSPVWLSLLIAFFAVILSVFAGMWAVVISLWSVFVSFAATALGVLIGGVAFGIIGYGTAGIAMIAACLVCAGLAILSFMGCKALTKGAALLTKGIVTWGKNRLTKKEAAQ